MEAANVREVLAKLIELSSSPELLHERIYDAQGALSIYWGISLNYSHIFGGKPIRSLQELDAPLKDGDSIIVGHF